MSLKHLQPTVFDSQPPDVYGSVTETQRERFLPAKKESLAGSPDASTTAGAYMTLRDQDRDSCNEYDYIPGENVAESVGRAKKTERPDFSSSSLVPPGPGPGGEEAVHGKKRVSKNAMYENQDVKQLLHPTLTWGGGKEAAGVEGGGKVGVAGARQSPSSCSCSTRSLIMAFFIAMAILLAVSSLGLSVLLWFGVNDTTSGETAPPSAGEATPEVDCQCTVENDITLLQKELRDLAAEISSLNSSYRYEAGTLYQNLTSRMNFIENMTGELGVEINSLLSSVRSTNYTISNVSSFFTSCKRRVHSCDLPGSETNCTTEFVNKTEDEVFTSATCIIEQNQGDHNMLVATLETDEEEDLMRCVCIRVGTARPKKVQCQLVVTTCPLVWDFSFSIITIM